MKKLKLMTIVGTRPEIIRLSEVIKACDKYFENILVHTGQNWDYTLNEIFFEQLELRQPDYYLGVVGNDLGETMGNIVSESYKILVQEKPDAVLILGDTNSCLAAISAKRLKVPVFHMEAGNRCFDQNVPEEINRKIVDHVSDINLTYTEHSRRYLLSEGARKDHVIVTGSPMTEVLKAHEKKINNSSILKELGLEKNKYMVVSAHREENIDLEKNFNILIDALNKVAENYNMPLVYSAHPRTAKRIKESNVQLNPLIKLMKPMGLFDYCSLQKHAFCTLSDSGTLSEESSILEFPAVLIRTSTERPEVLDKGTIVIGGISADEMMASIEIAVNSFGHGKHIRALDYTDENVSMKIVKIIQSYTKIVNSVIWKKY